MFLCLISLPFPFTHQYILSLGKYSPATMATNLEIFSASMEALLGLYVILQFWAYVSPDSYIGERVRFATPLPN